MKPPLDQKPSSRLLPLVWLSVVGGCASVAPYQPPELPIATVFTTGAKAAPIGSEAGQHGQAQKFVEGQMDAQWWRVLGSSELNELIGEALRASPTLATAQAVLVQARETVMVQTGAIQLPQVDLALGTQRQQVSPSAQGLTGNNREFNLYNASIGVRYRFDFGGGTDSSLRAFAARADIREHELNAARYALAANIAMTAITRARLAGQIDAQSGILNTQNELLRIAGVRARLGQAAPEEVSVLTVQAELIRASMPLLRKQLQQTEHLLAVLAGRPPAQGVPAFTLADFRLPEQLPVLVPSEWARQRPDILAAEAALRSAHAELGAVYARQYPQLNLSANLGSQALTTSALFGGAAAVWGLAGQLSQSLFNPSLTAERRAAHAAVDVAAANYQRVVLEALRSVADALRALEQDAESLAAMSRSVRAAEEQHRVTVRQLDAGVASAVQLLVADQMLLQARSGLVAAEAQRLTDTIALSASLAGDRRAEITEKVQAH